jgi:hypothetical protein
MIFLRAVGALVFTSCLGAACGAQAPTIVHLASGDSVAIISAGPAHVPNQPEGFQVRFYPYRPLDDTAQLRRQALELRSALRPQLDSTNAPFVVLQATNQTPEPHVGIWHAVNYGFVLEKRADGKWYFLHGTIPIDESH